MMIPCPMMEKGEYYMEKALYENIKELPKRIEKDKDCVAVFVGAPGEGKSTLAQQVLYLLDPTITTNTIKFSYEDYVKYCIRLFDAKKSKGMGVIHDEGRESLSGLSITTKRTKGFMNFLYENRQMNMYQFLLTGDFFDLPRSIAMQRLMFCVYVHEGDEFNNGFFKFYDRLALRKLYMRGKKERDINASGYTLRGSFTKGYTVNEQVYRRLKKSHLVVKRYIGGETREPTLKEVMKIILTRNPDVRPSQVRDTLKCDIGHFFQYRDEWRASISNINIEGEETQTENNLLIEGIKNE